MYHKVVAACLAVSALGLTSFTARPSRAVAGAQGLKTEAVAAEARREKSPPVENIRRSIIAYAKNASTDRKAINIPEGYAYVSHSTRITTANPQDGENTEWFRSDGVTRDPRNASRIIAVWVQVRAMGRPLFGASRWIGVELTVEMRPL
jgi:hypothetical protein